MDKQWYERPDVMLGVGVIGVVAMLVVPLPGFLLDTLIAVSLTLGLLILLTAMNVHSPADFSVFPTLLLGTTVFRLALNVSTTRMILTEGENADSYLIDAFGSFVLGGGDGAGRLVLGLIIYLILILVQIMVVTKGATRISEVAARFALDAMPGKQLAIDNELAANIINEQQATDKRKKVDDEANFYGAMDGASKFVQGDVRVGLIITAINIVGGLVVGMVVLNYPFTQALEVYVSFTIGDGLVSQMPALLITTATGVIVTRSVSEEDLPTEIKGQLFQNPMTLYVVGSALIASSVVPGFPTMTLLILGGMIIGLGVVISRRAQAQAEEEEAAAQKADSAPKRPEEYLDQIKVDPLEIELGYSLTPLVNPKTGGELLQQISNLRQKFAREMGLIVPPIRIRDNMELRAETYQIKVMGIVTGRGEVQASKLMATHPAQDGAEAIDGDEFVEPIFQTKAYWINPDQRETAENRGYQVVGPETILITHLTEIISTHASDLLGRQQVQSIVNNLKEEYGAVVEELQNAQPPVNTGEIQAILQNLVKEGVSIRNMVTILETVADNAQNRDPDYLTEAVRYALSRQIVLDYVDPTGKLPAITISPELERVMRAGLSARETGARIVALAPQRQTELRDALAQAYNDVQRTGHFPVFITTGDLRPALFTVLERLYNTNKFAVVSWEEVPKDIQVEEVGRAQVEVEEEAPTEF